MCLKKQNASLKWSTEKWFNTHTQKITYIFLTVTLLIRYFTEDCSRKWFLWKKKEKEKKTHGFFILSKNHGKNSRCLLFHISFSIASSTGFYSIQNEIDRYNLCAKLFLWQQVYFIQKQNKTKNIMPRSTQTSSMLVYWIRSINCKLNSLLNSIAQVYHY